MKINYRRSAIILVGSFILVYALVWAGKAFAADVTVEWTHPTQRVDGTAITMTEISSTEIQWGADVPSPTFPNGVSVPAPAATKIVIVAPGKWCFRAATKDTDGLQSDWTGNVCVNLKANPNKPVIIKLTRAPL
jgi:hypothetical protein